MDAGNVTGFSALTVSKSSHGPQGEEPTEIFEEADSRMSLHSTGREKPNLERGEMK